MRTLSNINLEKYGLTEADYQDCLKDIDNKIEGLNDMEWSEIVDKYNLNIHYDSLRKASTSPFGGYFRSNWVKNNLDNNSDDLDDKLREIKKERMKLQTLNLERTRIDRNEARQELFYEYVGDVCNTLPFPDFQPLNRKPNDDIEYCLNIADIHYGATFTSTNNEYSPAIAEQRFNYLKDRTIEFVEKHNLQHLNVMMLGDSIQGILRLSDLKINDSSVVKAVVAVSKLIGTFLNELSAYVQIDYYHVPSANHTQMRNLGSKASELADEDLEYVISHFIETTLIMNDRVQVHLAEDGDQYLDLNINGFNVIAGHGHTLKSVKGSLKDLSTLRNKRYDYGIFGHFHGGSIQTAYENNVNDCEIIVVPSFIGSDPYSDKLGVGSKASAQILGFDKQNGHTETYKIVLN